MIDSRMVLDYLTAHAFGKRQAIKRRDLAHALRVTVREAKHACEELRLAGVPICYSTDSDSGGVYLAQNEQEIQEAIGKIQRLALSLLRERSSLKRALKEAHERVIQRDLFGGVA